MKKNKLTTKKTSKIIKKSLKNHQNSIFSFPSSPTPSQLAVNFHLLKSLNHQKTLNLPLNHHIYTPLYPTKVLIDQSKASIYKSWHNKRQTASLPQEHIL